MLGDLLEMLEREESWRAINATEGGDGEEALGEHHDGAEQIRARGLPWGGGWLKVRSKPFPGSWPGKEADLARKSNNGMVGNVMLGWMKMDFRDVEWG